jgi:hypothetical protein
VSIEFGSAGFGIPNKNIVIELIVVNKAVLIHHNFSATACDGIPGSLCRIIFYSKK